MYPSQLNINVKKMEFVLTQFKEFSSRSATFNNQFTVFSSCRYYQAEDGQSRQILNTENALALLKKELVSAFEQLLS